MHWAIAGAGIARMPRRTVQTEIDRGTLVVVLPACAFAPRASAMKKNSAKRVTKRT